MYNVSIRAVHTFLAKAVDSMKGKYSKKLSNLPKFNKLVINFKEIADELKKLKK